MNNGGNGKFTECLVQKNLYPKKDTAFESEGLLATEELTILTSIRWW
jgi:hypothetical protein